MSDDFFADAKRLNRQIAALQKELSEIMPVVRFVTITPRRAASMRLAIMALKLLAEIGSTGEQMAIDDLEAMLKEAHS